MDCDYREAATALWGEAGAYVHDAYDRWRCLYPELPERLPITIGITAYGHCIGLTRPGWEHGPRITVFSGLFAKGRRHVDDVMVHEMLHSWLVVTGQESGHDGLPWYSTVRRLSPQVLLGRTLQVRRGSDRVSVRVPNPDPNGPRTVVRKRRVESAVQHRDVAGWPYSFRPDDYDWGEPIRCPTY
jgi:hypothetical protein